MTASGWLYARSLLLSFAIAWGASVRAEGETQGGSCKRFAFDQELDVEAVTALAHEAPERLLARIAGLGIEVLRVPSAAPGRPTNPLLTSLPVADARLLQQAEFHDSYQGRSIPRGAACCTTARDTVLIRDTATTYTLLHEVVHLLLVPADGVVMRSDLELRFAVALHRLGVYQQRLYADPWRLLNPIWRRDIRAAQQEVAELLFDRIRIGQSQEAIVEQVLAGCIDERSPFFDAARRAEGRRYGEAMIDNAVDVFNAVNASVEYGDQTVRQLHEDLAAGRLDPAPDARLTAQERDEFLAHAGGVRELLARVRLEIESLKRFYAR